MPDATPRGVERDPVLARERFDRSVLGEVRLRLVLDVVIQRKHRLLRIEDARRPDGLELLHDRGRVVVRHDVIGTQDDEVPGPDRAGRRPVGEVRLDDLLDDCLTHVDLLALPARLASRAPELPTRPGPTVQ